jgi:anti-sigma factor RsiW
MTMSCDRVRELAPGFVLGALDAAEMAAVHEHLIACRQPHQELRELGGVLPYLAVALEPVEPPARLRAAVIAAAQADLAAHPRSAQAIARRVATLPISTSVAQTPALETTPALVAPAVSGGTVVSLASARRSRRRRALAWATRVAAAVAVVVLVGYGFGVIREPGATPSPSGVEHVSGAQNRFGVLTPLGAGHAQGLVVLMPTNHLYVYVNGLAPTSGDQVYMVWVTAGSNISLAGYFRVDSQGDGTVQMDNVPRASSLWVQVCIEPNEHVTQPTGPTVASGTVLT